MSRRWARGQAGGHAGAELGAQGKVNISESTYALVKDEPGLAFTSRGKVMAKGKGEMEMYFVSRPLGDG